MAMHTDASHRKYFGALVLCPDAIIVPQYVEDASDKRFGHFDTTLRPVIFRWRAMYSAIPRELLRKAGAPEDREPDQVHITTHGIPSFAPWVDGFDYFSQAVWLAPRDGGSDIVVEIKPGREGKYSLNSADFDARARHANDPQQFDGGYGGGGGRGVGITTALAARWQYGANARGWRGRPSTNQEPSRHSDISPMNPLPPDWAFPPYEAPASEGPVIAGALAHGAEEEGEEGGWEVLASRGAGGPDTGGAAASS